MPFDGVMEDEDMNGEAESYCRLIYADWMESAAASWLLDQYSCCTMIIIVA